jgi:iron(III) transport system substrate-binding protein
MGRLRLPLFGLLLLATACGDEGGTEAPGNETRAEPVVIYADAPGEAALRPVFEALAADTGVRVTVREAPAAKNLDDVMNNTGAPPADILLTEGIADIWRAGDEGALRPLDADTGIGPVPAAFLDPDGQWFALAADPVVIVYGSAGDAARALAYTDLAADEFNGQLCLSSSSLPGNRALIAHLIAEFGPRPAERIVRRWIRNLPLPPFGSAAGLLEAVQAGTCRYAIARQSDVLAATPPPAYRLPPDASATVVSAYGIGLARHARYADSARQVLAWLAGSRGQDQFALATRTRSMAAPPPEWSTRPQAELGWLDDDARRLSERARWR